MNILVTGAEGTVGKPLCEELEARGHNVIRADRFHSSSQNFMRANISQYRQLESIFLNHKSIDFVYNLAAEFGRWNGEDFYEEVWESNVIGLKNIIELQRSYKFKLVHFSSSEVYGNWKEIMSENVLLQHPILQLNDYALSKWCNEVQIMNSISMHSTQSVIVRLFNTYGPGEDFHKYRSAICKFIWQALHEQQITLFENHYRSNTYISDCIRTLANIANNFISGRVYNIGNNDLQPMSKVVDLVMKHTKSTSEIKILDSEPHTTHTKIVDNELAKLELNHSDTVTLDEGIYQTVNWMKSRINQNL
jgi:dTDP-glucose 4,6-dehydratase